MTLLDHKLEVSTPQVHLRENIRPIKLIQLIFEPWNRMSILNSYLVDNFTIKTHPYVPMFHKNK